MKKVGGQKTETAVVAESKRWCFWSERKRVCTFTILSVAGEKHY